MAFKIVWQNIIHVLLHSFIQAGEKITAKGKWYHTNQNPDSIPRAAQNKGINLTNLVFLSRWIAPNKAWGEYQWGGFKITKYLQDSILHHSKQEQKIFFQLESLQPTIGLQQHQYLMFKLHILWHTGSLLYRTRFYSLYTFEQQKTPAIWAIPAKLFLTHSFSLTLWSQVQRFTSLDRIFKQKKNFDPAAGNLNRILKAYF